MTSKNTNESITKSINKSPTKTRSKANAGAGRRTTARIESYSVAAPYHIIYKNNNPYYPVGPHSHNAVELYLNLSDLPDVLLNDTVTAVPSGTLLIIPPFLVHQLYRVDSVYERYILSINSQWLESVFCDQGESLAYFNRSMTPLILPLDEADKILLISQLKDLLSIPNTLSSGAMTCLFGILSTIDGFVGKSFHIALPERNNLSQGALTNMEQPSPASQNRHSFVIERDNDNIEHGSSTQQTVNRMIAYIQKHIYESISVSDVAKHFYLNPDYVSRLFKNHVHVSVGNYISIQKTSSAQSLLREGYTVSEVQEKLGYSSYAYFFKSFKKNTGLTPSQYRNQYFKGKA